MSLALTAIFSFVIGLLVAGAGAHVFWTYCRNRGARVFIGGIFRGMKSQGIETIRVDSVVGPVWVGTLELARAVETAIENMRPPGDGGGIEEPDAS